MLPCNPKRPKGRVSGKYTFTTATEQENDMMRLKTIFAAALGAFALGMIGPALAASELAPFPNDKTSDIGMISAAADTDPLHAIGIQTEGDSGLDLGAGHVATLIGLDPVQQLDVRNHPSLVPDGGVLVLGTDFCVEPNDPGGGHLALSDSIFGAQTDHPLNGIATGHLKIAKILEGSGGAPVGHVPAA